MNDPNIASADPNGCLYIDNPKPSPYWLSPNVAMDTVALDTSDIYPGNINYTNVSVTWKGECSIPNQDSGLFAVVFDLYVGDPFLGMVPGTSPGQLYGIKTAWPQPNGLTISAGGPAVITKVGTWDPASIPTLSQPNHACLLARVYPFGATPDPGTLSGYPSGDLHYGQHNCTIQAAAPKGLFKLPIFNGSLSREPELVAIQAVPDLAPNPTVLNAVMGGLHQIPGFKQIATTPLKSVGLDVSAFKSPHESLLERIEEWIERLIMELIRDLEGKAGKAGGTHARVMIPPNFSAKFNFTADLSGATPGDAHIYHISQVNGKGDPWGGLTVAIVIT